MGHPRFKRLCEILKHNVQMIINKTEYTLNHWGNY